MSKGKIIGCLIALVLIVAIIGIIWSISNKNDEENNVNIEKNVSEIYNEANLNMENEQDRMETNQIPVEEDKNPTDVDVTSNT